METQLQTCYFTKKGPALVTLFGYSTKSIPGLEINGIGKFGKSIKEKIIYITRTRSLAVPIKRFVINVEMYDEVGELELSSIKWLEYPLLLHYWYLAGFLPISKLDNCFASGSVSPSGEIEEPFDFDIVQMCEINQLHLITSRCIHHQNGYIDSKDLFGEITDLKFKSKEFLPESEIR